MLKKQTIRIGTFFGMVLFGVLFFVSPFQAKEIDELSSDESVLIQEKKSAIEDIQKKMSEYQKKIEDQQQKNITLESELEWLQNRIEKTDLEMQETLARISLSNQEIALLEKQIQTIEQKLLAQKQYMQDILQKMQAEDHAIPMKIFYGTEQFSSLLDLMQKFKQINKELAESVEDAKANKIQLEVNKNNQITKQKQLEEYEQTLLVKQNQLQEETDSKVLLHTLTKQSEKKFQKMIQELKQEEVFIETQLKELQTRVEQKISRSDEPSANTDVLHWPILPNQKGISSQFHDPTYPFRHLFEHSGIDLPAQSGTSIKSAAPGYVAWTRRGAQYGNYVMVIHANGFATLYAHLSRIDVFPDQFVDTKTQIGLVGMTGLATGPHLHFEIRKEGIPVNPLSYLTP